MKNLSHPIYSIVTTLLTFFFIQTAIDPINALALGKVPSGVHSQNEYDKKFRQGKDLMDKEEWTGAAKIFLDITDKYSTNKSTDATLYWLAFCYKKTGRFNDAILILDRLLRDYPRSSWVSDASVLQLEVKTLTGDYDSILKSYEDRRASYEKLSKSYRELSESYSKEEKNYPVEPSPPSFDGSLSSPSEREDEVRLAAFLGVLAADPKRAIEMIEDLLKPDARTGDSLIRNALRSFRNSRFQRTFSRINSNELISQLREVLIKSYKNESNNIKYEIIYALAYLNDNEANNSLLQIYSQEKLNELKKVVIKSFNDLHFLSVENATNLTVSSPAKLEKLWEIFLAEKDNELRIFALTNLRQFTNWSAKSEVLETLFSIYETETDSAFKLEIIRSLAVKENQQALDKLMQIAQNDKNNKMRSEAIRLLQTIKTP
ncbi:MAG: HEAT repeat domain-containing protein [Pyrinomonadaceae bacterium]